MSAAGAGLLAVAGAARAQDRQSTRRIVVGATPGGGTDTVARLLAMELGRATGQGFVVENRPGAGGNIAAQAVAQAEPDGRTLLMCYTSHVINPSLYGTLPFDAVRDFTPIVHVASAPSILLAHPSVPADDMPGLIALAKARPGVLNVALPGIGSAGHLGAEEIRMRAGIDVVLVPYKGTAPAMNDLIGGQVHLMFAGPALAKGQLQQGTVKPLGVSSARRLASYPAIAPIADTLPGYDFNAWYGLLGPAGLADAPTRELSALATGLLAAPAFRQRLLEEGLMATGGTPEAFRAFLVAEIPRWGEVVKASGARAG